jgi:hypothetical protein
MYPNHLKATRRLLDSVTKRSIYWRKSSVCSIVVVELFYSFINKNLWIA